MSKESNAPNDAASAKKFVKKLASLPYVQAVLLGGSRSPSTKKEPHEKSDWDFVIVTSESKLMIPNPRLTGELHADVNCTTPDMRQHYNSHVEIHPTDKHNILN